MSTSNNSDCYKIKFVDRILDPVHGFIDITQVEKEIIALPIFKRLQSIKQLSLTNWVFPGAEHTRYMHSLGVMHIADLMALNLTDENHQFVFNDSQRQLLRLAGLLHDIGHYPLSHVTEHVYMDNLLYEDDTLLSHNLRIKKEIDELGKKKSCNIDYMNSRYSKPLHHEAMGAELIGNNSEIKNIIKKHCSFIDISDIQDIIVGCVDRNSNISVMVQLMHSELDADGIDYIVRDATFSGTSYGTFELGLLLRNLVVRKYNGADIVGIRPKGIPIVDQYLISKYFSYTQVIYNKHVAIYETMAEIMTKQFIKLDRAPYPKQEILIKDIKLNEKNDLFLRFTDRFFWSQIDSIKVEDLKGYVPEYVLSIHRNLSRYQDFETSDDGEIIITLNNREDVFNLLKSSHIYNNLIKDDKRLVIFHVKGFTSEVNESDFRDRLQKLGNDGKSESSEDLENRFLTKNTTRLQEGIPILEEGSNPKLLVDDSRSIMNHLYNTKTYILREYMIN